MYDRFKQSIISGFSIIEVVVALSLMSILFVLTLDILNVSNETTLINKEKFLINQALDNTIEEIKNKVKTQEIRYGIARISDCFAQVRFLTDDSVNCNETTLNSSIEYFGYNIKYQVRKQSDNLIADIKILKNTEEIETKNVIIQNL